MTPQTPERCGQQYGADGRANAPLYVCTLAAGHRAGFHQDIENSATWSRAGDLVEHASATPVPADGACGASLVFSKTGRAYSCGLPTGHANTSHYDGKENAHWSAVPHPDTAGTVMDAQTARHYAELVRLAAPSEDGALNLGPIVARNGLATNRNHFHDDIAASQADVVPLVREVMRLRRPTPAMPGDAVQRSALAGIARHIEDMRHVFAELLAATCAGCPIVANSSNPEDGADLEPIDGCPVHGEVAELRRQVEWAAQQQDRVATALGPEYLAPFGPDVTTEVLRLIELGRQHEGLQR